MTTAKFIKIKEGIYEIGFNGEGFCFDNELNRHKVYLNAFEISPALVTNAGIFGVYKCMAATRISGTGMLKAGTG